MKSKSRYTVAIVRNEFAIGFLSEYGLLFLIFGLRLAWEFRGRIFKKKE